MSDRAAGYVTDVGYTYGYHPTLNPVAARLPFLRAGLAPPRVLAACELGFGQGVSLAVHAAASPVRWWGCDLLPEHVGFARSLDQASGAGSVLVEATFREFDQRDDLPRFDFIGLHGVLSWVSAENRALIADFVGRRLAPGGVLYTACNALPGWSEILPLRRVMVEHASRAGTGATPARIEAALAFTGRLLDAHPLALRGSPGVPEHFLRLRASDPRYLAHEYFNRDWDPLYFGDMAKLFAGPGLQHACAAQLRDHLDELNLSGGQRRLLEEIADPCLRETVRDFMTGIQVRRDYWVREPRPLAPAALQAAWRETRLVLVTPREQVAERVTGPQGEIRLSGPAHQAVLSALLDHRPRTLAEVEAQAAGPGLLQDAAFELAACGYLAVAQDPATSEQRRSHTRGLNACLARAGSEAGGIAVRASPVTGGGVAVGTDPPPAWRAARRALGIEPGPGDGPA